MAVYHARGALSAFRAVLVLLASAVTACVTPAEFEKVRVKVVKMERTQAATRENTPARTGKWVFKSLTRSRTWLLPLA